MDFFFLLSRSSARHCRSEIIDHMPWDISIRSDKQGQKVYGLSMAPLEETVQVTGTALLGTILNQLPSNMLLGAQARRELLLRPFGMRVSPGYFLEP